MELVRYACTGGIVFSVMKPRIGTGLSRSLSSYRAVDSWPVVCLVPVVAISVESEGYILYSGIGGGGKGRRKERRGEKGE